MFRAVLSCVAISVALNLDAQTIPTYLLTTVAGTTQNVGFADGTPATALVFINSPGIAAGPDGSVFLYESGWVLKLTGDGTVQIVAGMGDGQTGSTGDGFPAVRAKIVANDIALDPAGNLYMVGEYGGRVRKVTSDGIIQTIAGREQRGFCGDGGPALEACFDFPVAIAADAAGNVYISDSQNHRVRMINPAGIITTLAGNGQQVLEGDGLPAAQASVGAPGDLALDGTGNLYVIEGSFNRVRMVTPQGTIRTVAGNGAKGYGGEGVPATSSPLAPSGIAVDDKGNLYVAEHDNYRVRKVTPQGIITTVAGTGDAGLRGDGGAATNAWLEPYLVAVDGAGKLYITGSLRVRQVGADGIIRTVAGGGTGDGGPAYMAKLGSVDDVTVTADGSLYLAEAGSHRVRRIAPSGTISTVAGMGIAGYAGDGVPATDALLNNPSGVAMDAAGNLYIADTGNNRVRKVDVSGQITTVAGTGVPGLSGDGGVATLARLASPLGLALDAAGSLYIAESGNHRIRRVTPSGIIETVAGSDPGFAGDGGRATLARLHTPSRVAVDGDGNLIISDTANARVRKVAPSGTITTIAGGDGELSSPLGLTFDKEGDLFFVDGGRHRVYRWPPGGALVAIAGNGSINGISGDAGPALAAQLNQPSGITAGLSGEIWYTDVWGNGFVRKLEPANIFPAGVVSAASFRPQFLSPGEIISIFWADMGPDAPVVASPDSGGRFPTSLAGTTVHFEDLRAPLLYVDRNQINAVVPYGLDGRVGTRLFVEHEGQKSNTVELAMAPASPALFTLGASGQGAILNQDFTVNSAANPAARGSVVMIYATGEGQTAPGGVDGLVAGAQPPKPVLPVSVKIGGKDAEVVYAGGVPTVVAGLMQVNARVPESVTPGNSVFVTIQVGGASSPTGVKMAVK